MTDERERRLKVWVVWQHRVCLVGMVLMGLGCSLALLHSLLGRWTPGLPAVLAQGLYGLGAGLAVSLTGLEHVQLRRARRALDAPPPQGPTAPSPPAPPIASVTAS